MMRLLSLLFAGSLVLAASVAWGQGDDNPPEILTSELSLKTILESERLEVNFVVVDSDKVTEVTINGEKQPITPADTVLITRPFVFRQDVTRVRVSATDEKGNTRTVTYTVYRPGVDPAVAEEKVEEKPKLRWFARYDVRFEIDDNPSNDLSSPIDIEGVDLTGVVPDDQQDDTRTNILVNGGIIFDKWTAYGGLSQLSYSDAANERFNTQAIFLGGTFTQPRGKSNAFLVGYTLTDLNIGEADYAQTHTISPAWRSDSTDSDGDSNRTTYALDIVNKSFALSAVQEDATVFALRWALNRQDKEKLDTYRRVFLLGVASEGIPDSEYSYLGGDWDWRNRWESGLLFDIGVGVHYRSYESDQPLATDTPLGSTRVDIPTRFSTALGWQFTPQVRVRGTYRYLFNLSNKSPYVRQIIGIAVNGAF